MSNYHGCKEEAINLIPHYLIDIIHKTVKSSHLEKLQIKQNINNVPSHLHIFWLNFDKANHSFLHPFRLGGNRFSKNSTWSFEWGTGAWVKMHRFNAFSGNVNTINWKKFSHTWWNIQVTKNSTSILEKDKPPKKCLNPWCSLFLKKREHQKKGSLKWKIDTSLHTLYYGFKKIPFTLYIYVLAKILLNSAKFMQKLTPGFKNHMKNLDNSRKAVESPKCWSLIGYFSQKKYIRSANTYTDDLPNIIFLSTTCVKIHQIPYMIF